MGELQNSSEGETTQTNPSVMNVGEPEDSEEEGEDPALDSLSQAIAFQQAHTEEEEEKRRKQVTEDVSQASTSEDTHKSRNKKSTYFSDDGDQ